MGIYFEKLRKLFWEFPLLGSAEKEWIYYFLKKRFRKHSKRELLVDAELKEYVDSILAIQTNSNEFEELNKTEYVRRDEDIKLWAYYLPQFYPTPYNDKWWGKGATEWRNVSKSMPQYIGHYQPRLPGELGFYDLRLLDNIKRQVELAKVSGIYGFCYYYYWFDGKRLLDLPVDLFFENDIQFPFFFCWVNENWTRQWFGTSDVPLIKLSETEENYKSFIHSIKQYIQDGRYFCVKGKKVLSVYKPQRIPNPKAVLKYWRDYIQQETGYDLYLIAVLNDSYDSCNVEELTEWGFDAINEFFLGPQRKYLRDIQETKKFVCNEFLGNVYDYAEFVKRKGYFSETLPHTYRAVAPMWDNTARKINKGFILDGATPALYKTWLIDVGKETNIRAQHGDLDDNLVFINAWNEWGEGAYLEPDMKFGYAYLNATKQAVLNVRSEEESRE